MVAQGEEATVQEEACEDLHHQDGTVADEVDDLRMDLRCKVSRQWVAERLLQDTTTTTTTTFTTKDHHPVSNHHMAEHLRLVRDHHCQLAKPLRWTTVQERLQQTMD
jgi:hypothetical protein